jgi:hypothetical protein
MLPSFLIGTTEYLSPLYSPTIAIFPFNSGFFFKSRSLTIHDDNGGDGDRDNDDDANGDAADAKGDCDCNDLLRSATA